jgi:putative DNA primase/helicase
VVLSDTARDAAALWVLHTWLVNCFFISPRAGVCSPVKGCAKSLLLDVFTHLVWRAQLTANVTPAAVFRVIDAHQPTLLIDEADTFLYDDDGLRGVLNGNRKSSQVLRTVGEQHEVRAFATYSACAIALIGQLPDTLHDRAIRLDLKRRLRSEMIEPYRPDRAGHLEVLARKEVRWVSDHADRVAAAEPEMPEGIINREADNWRPLLAIADVAGGEWPERARTAARAAHLAAADDDASLLELLLVDIRETFAVAGTTVKDMFGTEQIEITSANLTKALIQLVGRPWGEMGKSRKPLTQNRLARMLKPLAIAPEKVGPKDARVSGYVRAHFEEVFERYLTPLSAAGVKQPDIRTDADEISTSEISQPDTNPPGCPVANMQETQQPRDHGQMSGWKGGKGGKRHVSSRPKSDDLPYTGPVVEVPDHGPDPLDEHGAPRNTEPGLSRRRIQELADWYSDQSHQRYCEDRLDTATLDAELRMILREEVAFPEHVEVEFTRVMAEVFRV